ncbi:MAG TPA: hypothetical protein PLD48_07925 [Bacillota bacterium]|nr:hypothetical protein [Bacillota bacterium]HOK69487.1 hypothetical protein [Bacillota bacterium]HPP85689.1 hypothetical protein [Bacillota bacterium]
MVNQTVAKKRKTPPAVIILAIALIFAAVTLAAFYFLGYRYIRTDKVKFIGKVVNGQPVSGLLSYANGEKAKLDYYNATIVFDNGDKYVGQIKGLYRDGRGVMTYATTGDRYEGEFSQDEITGTGTYTYANGDVYTGSLLNNKMHGYGILVFASGDKYEGNFSNGLRSGSGVYTWKSGAKYDGSFVDDVKNGFGKMYYANGDYYEGQFVNDKRQGSGYYRWADGESYRGSFYNNLIDTRKVDGEGNFVKKDGKYVHGDMGVYTFANGRTYTGYFEAGEVVGVDFEIQPLQ